MGLGPAKPPSGYKPSKPPSGRTVSRGKAVPPSGVTPVGVTAVGAQASRTKTTTKKKGGFGLGDLLAPIKNTAIEAARLPYDIPVGLGTVGHAFQKDISSLAYHAAKGDLSPSTYHSAVGNLFKQMGKGYKEYYTHPSEIAKHPLQAGLDLVTLATGGGAAFAKLGRAGALGEKGIALAKHGTKEYNVGQGLKVTRPTSTNPVTRAGQNWRFALINKLTHDLPVVGDRYSEAARGLRLEKKGRARRIGVEQEKTLRPFDEATKGLTPGESVAVSIRHSGSNPKAYRAELAKWVAEDTAKLEAAATSAQKRYWRNVLKGHARTERWLSQAEKVWDSLDSNPKLLHAQKVMSNLVHVDEDIINAHGLISPQSMADRPYLLPRILSGARVVRSEDALLQAISQSEQIQKVFADIDATIPADHAEGVKSLIYNAARTEVKAKFPDATDVQQVGLVVKAMEALHSQIYEGKYIDPNTFGEQVALFQRELPPEGGVPPQESLFEQPAPVEPPLPPSKQEMPPERRDALRQEMAAQHDVGLPEAVNAEGMAQRFLDDPNIPLPEELRAPGVLAERIADVFENVKAGAGGKDWYETAAAISRWISQNDPAALKKKVTPVQIAQMIAVFSQSADTVANMAFLRKALDQWAEHKGVYAGMYPERQHVEILKILRGEKWEGRKRSSFYMNIIENLDPAEYAKLMDERVKSGISTPGEHPVTVDRWVTRWFQPDKVVPGKYYDSFEKIIQAMADEIGWTPKQVQASAWVATKQLSLAKRHPQWSISQVLKAGEDAYNVGYDRYFQNPQGQLPLGARTVHPNADRAANLANRPDGGGTLRENLSPDDMKVGYAASYGAFEQIAVSPIHGRIIEAYRDLHRAMLRGDKTLRVGIWNDPDTGLIYLDITRKFRNREEALAFAREQGQLAYWDARAGKSVSTGLDSKEANAIKVRLRNEHYGEPGRIAPPVEKLQRTPDATSAAETYESLLRRTAVQQGWVKDTKKPLSKENRKYAEELLDQTAKGTAFEEKLSDLRYRAAQEGSADIEAAFGPDTTRLKGLPEHRVPPSGEVQSLARAYMEEAGVPYRAPTEYVKVDHERAAAQARAYEQAPDAFAPSTPPKVRAEILRSYQAMADETLAQYRVLEKSGYTFEFMPKVNGKFKDPYESPWDAMVDLQENKHMYVYPTEEGFGTLSAAAKEHPLLQDTGLRWGGQKVTFNDLFRAVHDVFGHKKDGVGFRWDGEDAAWRAHSAMYSKEARKAMTAETRGQNSWVNFGPHGNKNRTAGQYDTVYAEQKATIMPDWVVNDGPVPKRVLKQTERETLRERDRVVWNDGEESWDGTITSISEDGIAKLKLDVGGTYEVPLNDLSARGQMIGLHGGKYRGAYEFLGDDQGRITVASGSAEADTWVHEVAHHLRRRLSGTHLERKYAGAAGAKRIELPNGKKGWSWDEAADEKFADMLGAYMREQPGKLGDWYRKQYYQRDLPDLTPGARAAFKAIVTKRAALEGKAWWGGTNIEDLRMALADAPPLYFPHAGPTAKSQRGIGRTAGSRPISKPDFVKWNQGWRVRFSQWIPDPGMLKIHHLKLMSYVRAKSMQDLAWRIAEPVDADLTLKQGYHYIVKDSKARPKRADIERGLLDEDINDITQATDLSNWIEENVTTSSKSQAQQWADEGLEIGQISDREFKTLFGEFKPAGDLLKRYDRVTDFWRTLTLTYRPAWVVNNFIGQGLLYFLHHGGRGSIRSFIQASKEEATAKRRERSPLAGELRFSGLYAHEAPVTKMRLSRIGKTEARIQAGIQTFNATWSDNVPRAAAQKQIVNRIAKANDSLGDLARQVKEGKLDLSDPRARKLEQVVVEEALNSLVDFGDLSAAERAVMRRVFPFYSWMKGIVKSSAYLLGNRPWVVLAMYLLARQGHDVSEEMFGKGSSILEGFVPYGELKGKKEGVVKGVSTLGANPFATVGSITAGAAGAVLGSKNPLDNLFLQTNPIIQTGVRAATKRDVFDRKLSDSNLIALLKSAGLSTPEAQTVVALVKPSTGPKKLTPQHRVDVILRYLGYPQTRKRVETAQSLAGLQESGR